MLQHNDNFCFCKELKGIVGNKFALARQTKVETVLYQTVRVKALLNFYNSTTWNLKFLIGIQIQAFTFLKLFCFALVPKLGGKFFPI